jgi:gas vesicle protein
MIDFIAPAIGILAIGLVAGAGIALMLAPSSGEKLREQLESKLSHAKSRLLAQGEGMSARPNNATAQIARQS